MKGIALISLLLITLTFSVEIRRPITGTQQEALHKIINEKKWASIILKLAELHMMNQGPIDTLVTAIENLVADLETKLQNAHDDFDITTNEHEKEVRRLDDLIRSCEIEIANAQSLIENILIPQKEQLEEEIANIERRLKELSEHIDEQTAQREINHQSFLERTQEHQDAITACEEAQELISSLQNGETELVQVENAKKSLENVAKKLKGHGAEDSFVKALLSLSTEQFSDQAALTKVWDLLDQIKNNLVSSLLEEGNDEEKAQADYDADMLQTRQDISESQKQLSETQGMHAQNEESIQNNKDLIDERTADRIGYENDLQQENDAYQRATDTYNALVQQLDTELDACKRALDVLNGAEIADYIGDRMQQDRVIDTNHGSQIRVNEDQWVDRV